MTPDDGRPPLPPADGGAGQNDEGVKVLPVAGVQGFPKGADAARPQNSGTARNSEASVLPQNFILGCLDANELGDGILFSTLHQGRFLFDSAVGGDGGWLRWAGHHWEIDRERRVTAGVEDCVDQYRLELTHQAEVVEAHRAKFQAEVDAWAEEVAEAKDGGIKKSEMPPPPRKPATLKAAEKRVKQLTARIFTLRGNERRNKCLTMAHTCGESSLVCVGDIFDASPHLLAGPNGVCDLRTGEIRPGHPDDYLIRRVGVPFPDDLDAPAPIWERFLETSIPDPEQRLFFQRWCGYSATGYINEHAWLCMLGERGRNGKTLAADTIQKILGGLAGPILSEMLMRESFTRSSSGPSPDVMSLRGLRLAVASENEEGARFSTAKIKKFTGGDRLSGRNPHDKYMISFDPTAKLMLLTNTMPSGPDSDDAFTDRMILLVWERQFVRNPSRVNQFQRDDKLEQKLIPEYPAILAWIIRGELDRQRMGGLCPPASMTERRDEYIQDQGQPFQMWLAERTVSISYAETEFAHLYKDFCDWWKSMNGGKVPSMKWLGCRLGRNGYDKNKSGSRTTYQGIELINKYGGNK